jgi:uncharacterized protein (DUF885 family)
VPETWDPADGSFELARYLGRPAQALTYKIGERTWLWWGYQTLSQI